MVSDFGSTGFDALTQIVDVIRKESTCFLNSSVTQASLKSLKKIFM